MATKAKLDGRPSLVDAFKTVKTKNKVSELLSYTCPICLDPIKDASNDCAGEDAIVCEGRCNTWLHRCAGLSKASYETATVLLRRSSVHIVDWTRMKPRLHLLSVSFNS